MDNPTKRDGQPGMLLIGVAAVLGAMGAAWAAWAGYSYYIMGRIPYGLVLLPVFAGSGPGLILRFAHKYLSQRVGMIAIVATVAGCILGDFTWIMISTTKPLSVLLGSELGMTLRTLFWYDKLLFYGITSYLAYAISIPQKPYMSE